MPPKKKAAGGQKKKKKSGAVVKKETDLTLPPVTTAATASLLYAVASSNVVEMGRLVSHYNFASTLSTVDRNNSTPLHMAAKRGDTAMLEKLLGFKQLPDSAVNAREVSSIGGYAAIHYACAGNHQQALAILLGRGADVNLKTQSSLEESPLHICCKAGPSTMACAKTLVDFRANVNAMDSFGHNCSYWANQKGHLDMIRELGLPEARAAGCDEYIAMMLSRPGFSMKKAKPKVISKKKK